MGTESRGAQGSQGTQGSQGMESRGWDLKDFRGSVAAIFAEGTVAAICRLAAGDQLPMPPGVAKQGWVHHCRKRGCTFAWSDLVWHSEDSRIDQLRASCPCWRLAASTSHVSTLTAPFIFDGGAAMHECATLEDIDIPCLHRNLLRRRLGSDQGFKGRCEVEMRAWPQITRPTWQSLRSRTADNTPAAQHAHSL